jgi:hypothetical protein
MNDVPIKYTDEYLKGMTDCHRGIPHESGHTQDYDSGYSAQYQHEQNMTELTSRKYGR